MSGYIISKPPHSPSLGWHQDGWFWDEEAGYGEHPSQLFAMIYLTNTSRRNGCLRVLPGTHRAEHPLHRKLGAAHSDAVRGVEEWEAAPEHADADGEADVAVAAGDRVFAVHVARGRRGRAGVRRGGTGEGERRGGEHG